MVKIPLGLWKTMIFSFGDWSDCVCPICKTGKSGPVILVPIPGTEVGNNVEAQQVHVLCAKLVAQILLEQTE